MAAQDKELIPIVPGIMLRFNESFEIIDSVVVEDMNGLDMNLNDRSVAYFWFDPVTGAYVDYNYATP